MADREEENYNFCLLPTGHRDHMCHMMEKGETEEIRSHTRTPVWECRNCGARADEKAVLCHPKPLEEGE